MKKITLLVCFLLTFAQPAVYAHDKNGWVNIARIETTYFPNNIKFQLTAPLGSCQSSNWISYIPKGNTTEEKHLNAQATLSILTAALLSNKKIHLYITQSNCSVDFIHLLNQ